MKFYNTNAYSAGFYDFGFLDWCEEKERSLRRSSAEKNTKKSTGYKKKLLYTTLKKKHEDNFSFYTELLFFPYSKPLGETEMPSRGT